MSRVIRFAWVLSPRGTTVHMAPGRVEGDLTRCGRIVGRGWKFWTPSRPRSGPPVCRTCAGAR